MADMSAVKAALEKVLALVNQSDVAGLPSMQAPAAPAEAAPPDAGAPPEAAAAAPCADCAAGTCSNPEHMSDEDADALAASLQ